MPVIDADIVDVHVGQAVVPGEIDGPSSAGRQVDHEEQRALLADLKRRVAADLDVVAVVDRVGCGDLAAIDMERLEPGGGNAELAHMAWVVHSLERLRLDDLTGIPLVPTV